MIDDVTIRVSNFAASKRFYPTVRAPLGYEAASGPSRSGAARPTTGPGRAAAVPGGYYAACLLDPDSNNVEAVCHNH